VPVAVNGQTVNVGSQNYVQNGHLFYLSQQMKFRANDAALYEASFAYAPALNALLDNLQTDLPALLGDRLRFEAPLQHIQDEIKKNQAVFIRTECFQAFLQSKLTKFFKFLLDKKFIKGYIKPLQDTPPQVILAEKTPQEGARAVSGKKSEKGQRGKGDKDKKVEEEKPQLAEIKYEDFYNLNEDE